MHRKNLASTCVGLISSMVLLVAAVLCGNVLRAAEPEMRGLWVWGPQLGLLKTRAAADKCVAQVDAAHLNAIFLLVWCENSDRVCYHSDLCPLIEGLEPDYDPLGYMIQECHRRGIEVHAWYVNGERSRKALAKHPDWAVQSGDSAGPGWYDFGKPEVRKFESDLMLEALRKYDLDGLHFDYIRYSGRVVCYCKHCQDEFAARYGFQPRYAPPRADAKLDAQQEQRRAEKWAEYRKDTVTELVRDVYRRAKRAKPKAQITAAVFTPLAAAGNVYQDWPRWLREGIIDFVIPMAYTADNHALARQIREWKTIDPRLERIVPGLALFQDMAPPVIGRRPQQVLAQHQLCLDQGARGNVYFWYGALDQPISAALVGKYYAAKVSPYHPPARH